MSKEHVTVELLAPQALARTQLGPSTMETSKVDYLLSAAERAQLRCTGGKIVWVRGVAVKVQFKLS